ncbi:MAG: magnesium transporter CorA family protein [bacterium]
MSNQDNYKKINNNIEKVVIDNPQTMNKIEWINILNAGQREINYLKEHFHFHPEHLKASNSKAFSYRPMVHDGGKYLFMILHFPVFSHGSIIAGEIEFFIGHGYLITVHNGNIKALGEFFESCKKNPTNLLAYEAESSAILLSEILNKLIRFCYTILDENSEAIDKVEEVIFAREQKEAVSTILDLRHNIINIRKILQNHKNILKKLVDIKSSVVQQSEIKKSYERLVDHSKRIWEILENQKEMIEVLNSTNESMLNNQLSNIMKTLTIFSVIVFPLTLLAAIFGMNAVNMPLVNMEHGFWYIIGIMLLGCFIMLLVFKKKKWLK